MAEYKSMADKLREDLGLPKPTVSPRPLTNGERFSEELRGLPPRVADPRHITMAEQFRLDMWKARQSGK